MKTMYQSKARCRLGDRAMPLVTESLWLSLKGMIWQASIKQMFFNKEQGQLEKARFDTPLLLTLVLTLIGTIAFGLFPEPVISFAIQAVASFPF